MKNQGAENQEPGLRENTPEGGHSAGPDTHEEAAGEGQEKTEDSHEKPAEMMRDKAPGSIEKPAGAMGGGKPGARRDGKLSKVLMTVSIASFSYLVLRLFVSAPRYIVPEAVFVAEIIILTLFTRSITAWFATKAFTRSILFATGITLLIGKGLFGFLLKIRPDSLLYSSFVAPPLEEFLKFAVVALTAYILYRRTGRGLTLSDWLLLGVMSGAGFGCMVKRKRVEKNDRAYRDSDRPCELGR
ncbi:MAG: PrsW family glutamic-type intramembrane protease [Candidatus Eremiobacteraeota bacterium]|nr:PrsW family glutamic-type intramembrane protease [Candidatus Eremiobacteraeota bacterium]